MKFTPEVIALCKKLHELGVRKDIQTRDCVYDVKYRTILLVVNHFQNLKFSTERNRAKLLDVRVHEVYEQYIPLWTWPDAREWLWNKGWHISYHSDLFNKEYRNILIKIGETNKCSEDRRYIDGVGKKDEEAILKCMVEIKKREKNV